MDNFLPRVQQDLKESMKAGDTVRVSTLRMLISALNYARIDKQADLSDDDVVKVLQSEAKKRKEAIEAYQATRPELADKETRELAVLKEYLPEEMPKEELQAKIAAIVQTVPDGQLSLGRVMGEVMKQIGGPGIDGNRVREIVEEMLVSK